jgi:cytochrome b involved in lipid metabolism
MATLLTYAEVAAHNSKKNLYVVIHDSVYNASSFVDEHPCVPPSPPAPGQKRAS